MDNINFPNSTAHHKYMFMNLKKQVQMQPIRLMTSSDQGAHTFVIQYDLGPKQPL